MISFDDIKDKKSAIAVVGLGYVGLPLAAAFSHRARVIGFDISEKKIDELRQNIDVTGELSSAQLQAAQIEYTSDPQSLAEGRFFVVTVPTPIDANKRPDLRPVEAASRTIGQHLQAGSVVVYESTVYPGVTEEICVPILEKESGLKNGVDFKVGYSPERINPGDKVHTVDKIVKVVSGQDDETLELVAQVYRLVVPSVHRASTIMVAEAAKVIENTQRDLNIALMNELALIFGRLGIDTSEVLAAAGSKWNFLPFTPGLVGGHCIGVDPYYLTFKAEAIGYQPQVILAGRRINDGMGKHVAEMTVKKLIAAGKQVKGSRVLLLGLTFKEDVPDIRNSKVIDIINELKEYQVDVQIVDPLASADEVQAHYGLQLGDEAQLERYDAVIWAVAHQAFKRDYSVARLRELLQHGSGQGSVIDVKSLLDRKQVEAAGLQYWSL